MGMSFEIGDAVPSFTLPDTAGVEHSLPADPAPEATVVIQMCNHCPFVQAWNPRVKAVAEEYTPRGVRFLAINSNDAERFPADSFDRMVQFATDQEWPMPYLHDEDQKVARALDAQVTPHLWILDREHTLVWTGAPDADPGDESEEENAGYLREALESVLAGCKPAIEERALRGCSVKWKPAPAS
jgi:peroxiredoxin